MNETPYLNELMAYIFNLKLKFNGETNRLRSLPFWKRRTKDIAHHVTFENVLDSIYSEASAAKDKAEKAPHLQPLPIDKEAHAATIMAFNYSLNKILNVKAKNIRDLDENFSKDSYYQKLLLEVERFQKNIAELKEAQHETTT